VFRNDSLSNINKLTRKQEIAEQIAEKKWVASLVPCLAQSVQRYCSDRVKVDVRSRPKLAYTCEIYEYSKASYNRLVDSDYEADLLIFDILDD
jgi:hypothetical protein